MFAATTYRSLGLAIAVSLLAVGCSTAESFKVYAPEWFGMQREADKLYIEASATPEQRRKLDPILRIARQKVVTYFGGDAHAASAVVCACVTEECYTAFGGRGSRAKSFGDSHILLSPRGLTAPILAHELSHVELHGRIGIFQMRRVPSWFDEGLAVVVSEEPTHSEQQWQTIVARGIPHPTLAELLTGDEWIDAVRKYGGEEDPKNPATGLFVVYSIAGHEVRRWFGNAGQIGLSDLIAAVEDGRDFQSAYEAAERLRAP